MSKVVCAMETPVQLKVNRTDLFFWCPKGLSQHANQRMSITQIRHTWMAFLSLMWENTFPYSTPANPRCVVENPEKVFAGNTDAQVSVEDDNLDAFCNAICATLFKNCTLVGDQPVYQPSGLFYLSLILS
jgi:hypothetical protein